MTVKQHSFKLNMTQNLTGLAGGWAPIGWSLLVARGRCLLALSLACSWSALIRSLRSVGGGSDKGTVYSFLCHNVRDSLPANACQLPPACDEQVLNPCVCRWY
jgi:hypothetical protein